MKLTDLAPQWMRYEKRDDGHTYFVPVEAISEAQGIKFLCPKCFAEKGTASGVHSVICWSRSRGAPEDARPGPGRWALDGTNFEDLTLNADPPGTKRSVLLIGGCEWHGFITNGEAA